MTRRQTLGTPRLLSGLVHEAEVLVDELSPEHWPSWVRDLVAAAQGQVWTTHADGLRYTTSLRLRVYADRPEYLMQAGEA